MFDIGPTLARLIDELGKERIPRTDEHIGQALRDLQTISPWTGSSPASLGAEFRDTLDCFVDAETRRTVRLTLGLDAPDESLTARRAMLRSGGLSGSSHRAIESAALARVLFAMLERGRVSLRRGFAPLGIVIEQVSVRAEFSKNGSHQMSVALLGRCESQYVELVLVPMMRMPSETALPYTLQVHPSDGKPRLYSGTPLVSYWTDRASPDYGWTHVIRPDNPLHYGDVVSIDIGTAQPIRNPAEDPKAGLAWLLNPPQALWWQCLGTEKQVGLVVTAPDDAMESLWGAQRVPGADAQIMPARLVRRKDGVCTWVYRCDNPVKSLAELRWRFGEPSLTTRAEISKISVTPE